jgi:hypothetical protein
MSHNKSSHQKSFTYIDPVSGQQETVQGTAQEIATLKKSLKAQAKALKAGGTALQPSSAAMALASLNNTPLAGAGAGGMWPSYIANLPPVNGPLGCPPSPRLGWLNQVLTTLLTTGRFIMPLDTKTEIFVANNQPLQLAYSSLAQLLAACNTAVAGQAAKVFNSQLWTGANQTIPAIGSGQTATTTFGVRIRFTDNLFNFKYGPITVNLVSSASGTPVVICTFTLLPRSLPVDVICLSISNNTGTATVVGQPDIGIQLLLANNPALVTSDLIYVEGLNARDIGTVANIG